MSALKQIVEWSKGRPLWQQDALRRLVERKTLDQQDVDELAAISKEAHGILRDAAIEVRPLSLRDCAATDEDGSAVRLLSLSEPQNINILESDEPLDVEKEGLTVVFGANGMGKSGYVRALKQMCRARGAAVPILKNVFEDCPGGPSSIRVRFEVDGEEREFHWEDAVEPPAELRAVTVFDEDSASVYVDERCDVEYLPFGLDLLPRLTAICRELDQGMGKELTELEASRRVLPEVPEGSSAARLLERLDDVSTKARLEGLKPLSDDERTRREQLRSALAETSPEVRSKNLERQASRFRAVADGVSETVKNVSRDTVEALKEAIESRATLEAALVVASAEAFASEPIPAVGTRAWRTLWDAARDFAVNDVAPDREFPPAKGEFCPLCQQELLDPAAARLQRFHDFVQGETRRKLTEAEEKVTRSFAAVPTEELGVAEDVASALEDSEPESAARYRTWVATTEARRAAMKGAQAVGDLVGIPTLSEVDPVPDLRAKADRLEAEATTLKAAVADEARDELRREFAELEGRHLLVSNRPQVLSEIHRRIKLRRLNAARGDLNTGPITRRLTEMTRKEVTTRLAKGFRTELNGLRLNRIPIRVAGSPGERGVAFHEVQLAGVDTKSTKPREVLSRGEHRCVSLAAFLAEQETLGGSSTLVFDDPVSSLDHDRRGHVAKRMVELSRGRPILVFTHDVAFLHQLQQHAEREGAEMRALQLTRRKDRVGLVRSDWPWEGLRTKKRIGALKQRLQAAESVYQKGTLLEYQSLVVALYGSLRDAWEKAVEEVLLNEAVVRFRRSIETNRLRRLGAIGPELTERLEAGMTKASRWIEGHAAPGETGEDHPAPDEVRADVEELEAWVKDLRKIHES